MRPNLPTALFSTTATQGRRKVLLAIGPTEEGGPVACYRFESKADGNIELLYLYSGDDSYQLWRSYMQDLAQLEEGPWQIEASDRPKASEVECA